MTSETVQALERIQRQIARLRELQSRIRELRAAGQISPDDYTYQMARCERAIANSASYYALLLAEHRIKAAAIARAITQATVQLSLF